MSNSQAHKGKIIFCDNTLWGLINFRGYVISHLLSSGYKIVVVAPQDRKSAMKVEIPEGLKYIPIELDRGGRNPFGDLAFMYKLLRIYRSEKPDYIFHYTIKPNIYGTFAASLLKIPSTAMIAGLGFVFFNKGFSNLVAKKLYSIAMRLCDKVFVLNEDNYQTLLNERIVCKEKMCLLRGGEGVVLNDFPVASNRSAEVCFLMVARVLYEKGYEYFVNAAREIKKEYKNARFQLLGSVDPSYPRSVPQEQIDRDVESGCIDYLGFTEDVISVMGKKGTVVVIPSFYGEGLNRSLMEACALGKPIITTDIPGCREAVENGKNGYLVLPKNLESLLDAIRRYMELDESEKEAMAEASREKAEIYFTHHHVLKEYENVLNTYMVQK